MRFLAVLFALLWTVNLQAAEISFPPLTGRVVDQAHVLSAGAVRKLDQDLADHEATTRQQVVVATVSSLQGRDIAEYGYQLGRAWGIGEKDKNTGAILLVAPTERQVRIEVGYGLEGTLTDALSRAIIEQRMIPEFRAGRMEAGILGGTAAILGTLRGDAPIKPAKRINHREDPGVPPWLMIIIFIVFLLLSRGGRRSGLLPGVMLGGPTIWRGGGGGGDGGGFGGGGGSFGGGGASGKW